MSGVLGVRRAYLANRRLWLVMRAAAGNNIHSPSCTFLATTPRYLSYSPPPAYRRSRPTRRRKPDLKSNSDDKDRPKINMRDRLWKQLQKEFYTDKSTLTNSNRTRISQQRQKKAKDPSKGYSRREDRLKDVVKDVLKEFREGIRRYQESLFPQAKDDTSKNPRYTSIVDVLDQLHELCTSASGGGGGDGDDISSAQITHEAMTKTESQFRDFATLMRKLISLCTQLRRDQKDDIVVAEELIRRLPQVKADRALLYKKVAEEVQQSTKSSFTGWIQRIFVHSPEPENEETSRERSKQTPLVHEETSFGPNKRQFVDVMSSISREAERYRNWEPDSWDGYREKEHMIILRDESREAREGLLKCAERMSALLDLLPNEGIRPICQLTRPAIETYASVGSIESARQAEYIYSVVCEKRVPRDMFHSVLRGYQLAARMEEKGQARADAVERAQTILQEREGYSSAGAFYSASNDSRAESFLLVLETMRIARPKSIAYCITQQEKLIKLFLGERRFNQVVEYNDSPPPSADLSVFRPLVAMYTSSYNAVLDQRNFIDRAKNILQCAQDQRAARAIAAHEGSFPDLETYYFVIAAVRRRNARKALEIARKKHEQRASHLLAEMKEEAMYATSLLDSMVLYNSSKPSAEIFTQLLKLWSTLPASGERADEILSRMSIRQGCEGSSFQANGGYEYKAALECWVRSAEASVPGVLDRALRIIDKMEAQGGVHESSIPSLESYSGAEKHIARAVYDNYSPVAVCQGYNMGIRVCSLCLDEPEAALEAAFDLYNRMIKGGINPDKKTFIHLLACCRNLIGNDSERRAELKRTVLAFASDHGLDLNKLENKRKTSK